MLKYTSSKQRINMQIKELNREAFDNALSYAPDLIDDLEVFQQCENQEVAFEDFCMNNGVEFNENGTPL